MFGFFSSAWKKLSGAFVMSTAQERKQCQREYWDIVACSRNPVFFDVLKVPDDWDGRFDLLSLHMFVLVDYLRRSGQSGRADQFVNVMFDDIERSHREVGVGDMSIGRKLRRDVQRWLGRFQAYEQACQALPDQTSLAKAIARNIFWKAPLAHSHEAEQLANMVVTWQQCLNAVSEDIMLSQCFTVKTREIADAC